MKVMERIGLTSYWTLGQRGSESLCRISANFWSRVGTMSTTRIMGQGWMH